MRCDHAERVLLGGPSTPGPEVAAHVAACERCAALHARRLRLDALLDRHEDPAVGPGFDTRFFARLETERASERRRRWFRWSWALVPAAAAVALATFQAPSPESTVKEVPADELPLVMDLPLVEDLDLVEKLDEVEAFDVLGKVDDAELDAILAEASR
jgi:hypothetical protein